MDYPSDEALERICDAQWSGGKGEGVVIIDAYQHNACNHTLSGRIVAEDGVEYGFVIDNGDRAGTAVRQWGLAEDVGVYEPPPPPEPLTFIPSSNIHIDRPGMFKVYLYWREESWFKEKERGYNYDRHFQPGGQVETHYRSWAATKGMKVGMLSDICITGTCLFPDGKYNAALHKTLLENLVIA